MKTQSDSQVAVFCQLLFCFLVVQLNLEQQDSCEELHLAIGCSRDSPRVAGARVLW